MQNNVAEDSSDPRKRRAHRRVSEVELRKQRSAARRLCRRAKALQGLLDSAKEPLDVLGSLVADPSAEAWTAKALENVEAILADRLPWWSNWTKAVNNLFPDTAQLETSHTIVKEWNRIVSTLHRENIKLLRRLVSCKLDHSALRQIRAEFREGTGTQLDRLWKTSDVFLHRKTRRKPAVAPTGLAAKNWAQCSVLLHQLEPRIRLGVGKGGTKAKKMDFPISPRLWNALQLLQLGPSDLNDVSASTGRRIASDLRQFLKQRFSVKTDTGPMTLDRSTKEYTAVFRIDAMPDHAPHQLGSDVLGLIPDPKSLDE